MAFGDIDIPYFHEQGFERKVCKVTNLWYWSRDQTRETSGDTTEDEYTFIGAPIISGYTQRGKALKDAMRETILSYFEENAHDRNAPYPILARWRDEQGWATTRRASRKGYRLLDVAARPTAPKTRP